MKIFLLITLVTLLAAPLLAQPQAPTDNGLVQNAAAKVDANAGAADEYIDIDEPLREGDIKVTGRAVGPLKFYPCMNGLASWTAYRPPRPLRSVRP